MPIKKAVGKIKNKILYVCNLLNGSGRRLAKKAGSLSPKKITSVVVCAAVTLSLISIGSTPGGIGDDTGGVLTEAPGDYAYIPTEISEIYDKSANTSESAESGASDTVLPTPSKPERKAAAAATPTGSKQTQERTPHPSQTASAADPSNSVWLNALAYIGYKIQLLRDEGNLFKKGTYGSSTPAKYRSGVPYGTGCTGLETTADSLPDVAKFKKGGLVCASFVGYVYLNYLPNVAGWDVSELYAAVEATKLNIQSVNAWFGALEKLVSQKKCEKIATSYGNIQKSKLTPGSIVIFKKSGRYSHIGIYVGTHSGSMFMIHCGANPAGPTIQTIEAVQYHGGGLSVAGVYTPPYKGKGYIEVNAKDENGRPLSGAAFDVYSGSKKIGEIGPTDEKGYAKSNRLEFGTYTVKTIAMPQNYREKGAGEQTVTLNDETPRSICTVNAEAEPIPGICKIVKIVKAGAAEGIEYCVRGPDGYQKTIETAENGTAVINELRPGSYTVSEVSETYVPTEPQTVEIFSGQTSIVTFEGSLKRGGLTATLKAEGSLPAGAKFRLRGISLCGIEVDEIAETDIYGKARFENIPIGDNYKLELDGISEHYKRPESRTVAIEWGKTSEHTVEIYFYANTGKSGIRFTGRILCALRKRSALKPVQQGFSCTRGTSVTNPDKL